jgi:DDE family transposase
MHVPSYLSHWLDRYTVVGHQARAAALRKAVQALLVGRKLSLTHIGRHRAGSAHAKHHIKALDRLLGNQHLHKERDDIYRAIARSLLFRTKRPVIVVDWSDTEPGREWVMLKAAVPIGGRAISIYERVYPFSRYNSPGAHREFLRALRSILPRDARPILITDAGFRGPWFEEVASLGWDWVGRIRNKIKYFREETGRWCYTDSLYKQATAKTVHLGEATLSRRHSYRFRLYLVRAHQRRVGRPRRRGPKKPNTTMYRRLHRAPWLLATSLPHDRGAARRIKQLYTQRMQIEETFRDVKCHRWGFGLRYARCRTAQRMEILLLIACLATFALWLVGLATLAQNRARHFQANTVRIRPVLSTVFIGQQVLSRGNVDIDTNVLHGALDRLRELVLDALPV